MHNSPLGAYESVEKAALSGRELEAHVLFRAANLMAHAQEQWGKPGFEEVLEESLRHNQKVWSFFQAEITQPDNPLPSDIKKNLLALSVFIDKRIFDIMAFPEARKLNILIEINRNLASGLRNDPGASPEAQGSPAQTP